MPSLDIKEISPRYYALRAHRLRRLKRSLERRDYRVDSLQIAGEMIREAGSFELAQKLAD